MSRKDDDQYLLAFHGGLEPAPAQTVRVFQRQDAEWAALGADAALFAELVYKTGSAIRQTGKQTPLCTANTTLLKQFLKDALQSRGLRVELYELDAGSKSKWRAPRVASPGNLQELREYLETANENPVIMALRLGRAPTGERVVGECFVDAESLTVGLQQFSDTELLSNLESSVIQLGVKELLVPDDIEERVVELMSRLDVLVTRRKPAQFSAKNVAGDLQRLTGAPEFKLQSELALEHACAACGALLAYLDLLARPHNFGHFKVVKHDLDAYMKLDAAALRALNVMPSARDGAKTMSLYGLLNQCRTVAGTRLLAQWLKQPLTREAAINERLDVVAEFIENSVLRQRLQEDLLPSVPDMLKIARKFHAGKARLEDVVNIYHLAIRLPEFVEEFTMEQPNGTYDPQDEGAGGTSVQVAMRKLYLAPLAAASADLLKLVELVETTIDLAALARHEYVVKADFDADLAGLRQQRDRVSSDMAGELDTVNDLLNTDKVKLENNPTLGWAFRLTRTDAGCLRNRTEFIDLKTQKSGQFFTTKALRALATQHAELGEQYARAQSAVATEVVNVASTYLPILVPLGAALAHLDVLLSFAQVAAFGKQPYVRPTFGGEVHLVQARHPCMEVQSDMLFIPNDVHMDRAHAQFNIVTGPNMGGKSTYIRQVGVIALLAQLGSFVPCDKAELAIMDCVLARVGASDSQLKGISTFMAEMLETASILKHASARSLIIVDELGRGTSTYDGFGLAYAISEHIVEKLGSWCLFATHFHELTALADKHAVVANLHVVASTGEEAEDDITLLYRVEPGISTKSFGIHVAEAVHFPEKVVRMAKRKARELESGACDENQAKQLKACLREWRAAVGPNDTREEKVDKLRAAVQRTGLQIGSDA